MNAFQKAVSICTLVGALSGCETNTSTLAQTAVLKGNPISVGESFARRYGNIAIVIEKDAKYIVAEGAIGDFDTEKAAEAVALVEAAIKLNEKIELIGRYEEDKFKIKTLNTKDHRITFYYP